MAVDAVREDHVRALLAADLVAARGIVDGALAVGVPAAAIYLDVLQPTLYEIGRLWSRAEITVAQVVALSAALAERVPTVAAMCAELRALDPPPYVLVGGQAFAGSRERALRTGADAFAADAAGAVRALRERFPAAA